MLKLSFWKLFYKRQNWYKLLNGGDDDRAHGGDALLGTHPDTLLGIHLVEDSLAEIPVVHHIPVKDNLAGDSLVGILVGTNFNMQLADNSANIYPSHNTQILPQSNPRKVY
jgi:hypothetical protein